MSKGTRVYGVRLPDELMECVQQQIRRRNDHSKEAPWVLSDFIRIALAEKLAKMERGRRGQRKIAAGPAEQWKDGEFGKLQLPGEQSEEE